MTWGRDGGRSGNGGRGRGIGRPKAGGDRDGKGEGVDGGDDGLQFWKHVFDEIEILEDAMASYTRGVDVGLGPVSQKLMNLIGESPELVVR